MWNKFNKVKKLNTKKRIRIGNWKKYKLSKLKREYYIKYEG